MRILKFHNPVTSLVGLNRHWTVFALEVHDEPAAFMLARAYCVPQRKIYHYGLQDINHLICLRCSKYCNMNGCSKPKCIIEQNQRCRDTRDVTVTNSTARRERIDHIISFYFKNKTVETPSAASSASRKCRLTDWG